MPRAELVVPDDVGGDKTFVKILNTDEMTVLIKDSFINWKDLVINIRFLCSIQLKDIFEKRISQKHYKESKTQPNTLMIHREEIVP